MQQIVDLTAAGQQRIIRTNNSELTGNWINSNGPSPTQQLGDALLQLPDLEGFLFKSSKVNAQCLAIFPDKLAGVSRVQFLNEQTGKVEVLT